MALKGLPDHNFGAYVHTIQLRGAWGIVGDKVVMLVFLQVGIRGLQKMALLLIKIIYGVYVYIYILRSTVELLVIGNPHLTGLG